MYAIDNNQMKERKKERRSASTFSESADQAMVYRSYDTKVKLPTILLLLLKIIFMNNIN